jgi:hypothetical protein
MKQGNGRLFAGSLVVLLALSLAASIHGCSGCSSKAPLAFVPEDAVFVALVPTVKDAIKGASALLDKFKDAAPIKVGLDKTKGQLIKELGFDPEKPESIRAKGIDPDKGIAVSVDPDGEGTTVVLGVSDPKAVEKFLRELANKYMGGAATFKEKTVGGVKATILTRQGAEDRAFAAWVHVEGHVVICPRAKDQKVAEQASKIATLKSSIKDNGTFKLLRKKIGKHHAMIYVDGAAAAKMIKARNAAKLKTASEWMQKIIKEQQETTNSFLAYFRGAALGLHVSEKGLTLRGFSAIPEEKGKVVVEILKGQGKAPDFGEFISPDALALGRLSLNAKKLMDKMVELMPPQIKRKFYRDIDRFEQQTKVNVEKDMMTLLSGRYAFALFAPGGEVLKKGFNIRKPAEMVSSVPVIGMAQVTDKEKAGAMLQTLERVMTRDGMDVRVKTEGKSKIYYIGPTDKPIVSWAIAKNVAVVGTGDRLAKALALINKGGDNVLGQIDSSRAKKLFKRDEGIVFYYNIQKTSDVVRGLNLPTELKLMLSTVTSTMAKFNDVTWSFEVEDDGVMGEVAVRVK